MGWIEHGDASYIELKNARIAALESQLAEANGRIEALTNALKMISPLMNNLEAKLLIGDEACIWAAEIVRDALRTPPPASAAKGEGE